jgi:hypothetical protein
MAFLLAKPTPHNVNYDNDRFSMFNKKRDIPAAVTTIGYARSRSSWSACNPT